MIEPLVPTAPAEFASRNLRGLTRLVSESGAHCTTTDTEGVWYVKDSGDQQVFLLDYLFNWRLVTSWIHEPLFYTGGWCYQGKDYDTFMQALDRAWEFDPYRDGAPRGFFKEVLVFQPTVGGPVPRNSEPPT